MPLVPEFQRSSRLLSKCNGCDTDTVVSAERHTTAVDIMAAVFDGRLATGSAHDALAAS